MDGKWIALEEQTRRFALDKKRPAEGRLMINGDNMLVDIRNLKPDPSGYKLFFIGQKNDNSVYTIVDEIVPDRRGAVSLKKKVDPENLDGEGTDLSCFYIFMVAAMTAPIRPVLKGDLVKPENKATDNGSTCRTYNDYYSEYIQQKTAALMASSDMYADISPFDGSWLADNWKRVTDPSLFPVASGGAEKQIRKYGHFIFGATDKHFYLAAPGRHIEDEWPDRGRSGFVLWQSIRGSDEYGYWAMVIDRKKGIITEIS